MAQSTSMSTLTLYETMSDISGQMAEAARACDWDRLVALEAKCTSLTGNLAANEVSMPVPAELRARKVQLIHKILADDAEVRRHTEPWMEQVKQFLGAGVRAREVRDVRRAYGAESPISGQ